jgi:hypothetical protein
LIIEFHFHGGIDVLGPSHVIDVGFHVVLAHRLIIHIIFAQILQIVELVEELGVVALFVLVTWLAFVAICITVFTSTVFFLSQRLEIFL